MSLLEDDKIANRGTLIFLLRFDTWGLPLKTLPSLCHFNLFFKCLWSFQGHRSTHGQCLVTRFQSCGQRWQRLWKPGRRWGKKRSFFLTTYNLIPPITHLFSEISNGWRHRPGLHFMHLRVKGFLRSNYHSRDRVTVGTFWEEADREGEARGLRTETGIECDGNCFPLCTPEGTKRTNKKQQG